MQKCGTENHLFQNNNRTAHKLRNTKLQRDNYRRKFCRKASFLRFVHPQCCFFVEILNTVGGTASESDLMQSRQADADADADEHAQRLGRGGRRETGGTGNPRGWASAPSDGRYAAAVDCMRAAASSSRRGSAPASFFGSDMTWRKFRAPGSPAMRPSMWRVMLLSLSPRAAWASSCA